MKKAEPGAWGKLDIPRDIKKVEEKVEEPVATQVVDDDVDDLDLDDLDLSPMKATLSNAASNGRTGQEIV